MFGKQIWIATIGTIQSYVVVPNIGGPQYRLQNTIILVIGTPTKGTPNSGKPPYQRSANSRMDRPVRASLDPLMHGEPKRPESNGHCLYAAVQSAPVAQFYTLGVEGFTTEDR